MDLERLSDQLITNFQNKFRERYQAETSQPYKNNPLHGEFVISVLGNHFRTLTSTQQSYVKTGVVDRWDFHILVLFLLSYVPKKIPSEKLKRENEIIKKVKFLSENQDVFIRRKGLIECLKGLCESNGEEYFEEEVKFKLDTDQDSIKALSIPGYIINQKMEKECLRLKDLGNELFAKKEWLRASEKYCEAMELSVGNLNDITYKTKAILYLNRAIAKFELYKNKSRKSLGHIDIEISAKINDCIVDAKIAGQYFPKWGKIYYKLSQFVCHAGDFRDYFEGLIYANCAIQLEPDNKVFQNHALNIGKIQKARQDYANRIKAGQSIDFVSIAKKYIQSNPFDINKELKKLGLNIDGIKLGKESNDWKNQIIYLTTLPEDYVNSFAFYRDASKLLDKKEYKSAFEYLAKSISFGESLSYSGGYYELARMYECGILVESNHEKAMSLYYRAAIKKYNVEFEMKPGFNEDDHLRGMKVHLRREYPVLSSRRMLGLIFHDGVGTDRDIYQSVYYLRSVAKQPRDIMECSGDASLSLGRILYYTQIKDIQDKKEAIQVLKRGANELNHSGCMDELSQILKIEDPVEAAKLMSLALSNKKHHGGSCVKHCIGETIYMQELSHEYSTVFQYRSLSRFKQEENSKMALRLLNVIDLTNDFKIKFEKSKSKTDKIESFKSLCNAFCKKEIYAVQLSDEIRDSAIQFLNNEIKSLSSTKQQLTTSKHLRLSLIGLNCFNLKDRSNPRSECCLVDGSEAMIKLINDTIKQISTLSPFEKEIFIFYKSIYKRFLGDLEESLVDINKCITMSSNREHNDESDDVIDVYHYYKADTLSHLIRYEEAIQSFNQYLKLSPKDGKYINNANYSIAAFKYLLSKNREQAELDFKQASDNESSSLFCFLPYKGPFYMKFSDPNLNFDSYLELNSSKVVIPVLK